MINPRLTAILLGALLSGSRVHASASFDCAKAQSWSEKLICDDIELRQEDNAMATLYVKTLDLFPTSKKDDIRKTQKEWLKQREMCSAIDEQHKGDDKWQTDERRAPEKDCLDIMYRGRIATFDALSNSVTRTLCLDRGLCDTVRVSTAGIDDGGNSLQIIHLCTMNKKMKEDTGHVHPFVDSDCGFSKTQEYWLTVQKDGALITKQFLVAGGLADRTLSGGVGGGLADEEGSTISIGTNEFTVKINGYFTMGYDCIRHKTITLQLSPLRMIVDCLRARGQDCASDGYHDECPNPPATPAFKVDSPIFTCNGYWTCDRNK